MQDKILIIDAHPVYADKLIAFLKGLTFKKITLIRSGIESIKKIQQEKPDLVILSAMLPDTDSQIICQKITSLRPSTKVIVQIGLFTDENTIAQFKTNGANAVIARKEKNLLPLQKNIEKLLKIISSKKKKDS